MQGTWSNSTIVTSAVDFDSDTVSVSSLDEREEDWEARLEDLISIRALESDWDGMGAEGPHPELVDSALELVRSLRESAILPPPSRIVASPLGALVFEWQSDSSYLEVEIPQPGCFQWMFETPGKQTEHWEYEVETNQNVTTISSPTGYRPPELSYGF